MTSNRTDRRSSEPGSKHSNGGDPLHPAWHAFIRYCAEMQHGDIERLRIQDGVPVLAEVTTKKIKFTA